MAEKRSREPIVSATIREYIRGVINIRMNIVKMIFRNLKSLNLLVKNVGNVGKEISVGTKKSTLSPV